MSVDPGNRLVATELEASWNQKLRYLEEMQQKLTEKKEKRFRASRTSRQERYH